MREHGPNCSAELHSAVPQVCNLRSVGVKGAPSVFQRPADCESATQQIKNLRYSRAMPAPASNPSQPFAPLISPRALMGIRNLQLRAHLGCSAELRSAVSQVSNLRGVMTKVARRVSERSADCKPAIQQIENLRYGGTVTTVCLVAFFHRERGTGWWDRRPRLSPSGRCPRLPLRSPGGAPGRPPTGEAPVPLSLAIASDKKMRLAYL